MRRLRSCRVRKILSVLCLSFTTAWACQAGDETEGPTYQGRSFRDWKALLKDPNAQARAGAVRAMRHLGTDAVPLLAEALKDEAPSVRKEAAEVLMFFGVD